MRKEYFNAFFALPFYTLRECHYDILCYHVLKKKRHLVKQKVNFIFVNHHDIQECSDICLLPFPPVAKIHTFLNYIVQNKKGTKTT